MVVVYTLAVIGAWFVVSVSGAALAIIIVRGLDRSDGYGHGPFEGGGS